MIGLPSTRWRGSLKFILGSLLGFMCCYAWLSAPTYTSLSDSAMFYPQSLKSDGQELQRASRTTESHVQNESSYKDNSSVADRLKSKIRVLCFIPTQPKHHNTKARGVKRTWGKRCNTILFMSSQKDDTLPTVALPVGEGRNQLWNKTRLSMKYIYDHYTDQYDWVLKADDNTYVIMENLRYLLSAYDPNEALHLGCRAKFKTLKQGFMFGGAGYVMSKKSVEMYVKDGLHAESCRPNSPWAEDMNMSRCLEALGVKKVESRDGFERERFFQIHLHEIIDPKRWPKWSWSWIYFTKSLSRPISNTAISFHRISPKQMDIFEFLLYRLKKFGVTHSVEETSVVPGGKNISTILQKLL